MGIFNILRGNINHPQITHKKSIKKLLHYRGDILLYLFIESMSILSGSVGKRFKPSGGIQEKS
ncbi:hypothetical protein UZ38_39935 [Bacillus amyloliquefaciens]|nr:hypothetical protein UZ38_39935 [Bacillus amyloliquefaciens]KUL07792.1 hypothetical protein LI7559_17900 [Bacillus licheniformis LMG 7559]